VLIGTSLEEESDQVVRSGLAVARAAGAKVFLVHAARIEPRLLHYEAGLGRDFVQEQMAWREQMLRQQIERAGIGTPELAGFRIMTGAPHRILVDAVKTCGADLIVVGATGAGPFAELLGSTADRILRKAPCPVLLVRGELRMPPRRVLAPVDLSTLSGDAFRCGLHLLTQLAKTEEIDVRAVYAMSFLDALAMRHQAGEISFEEVERRDAEELRRFLLENRPEPGLRIETAILPGEARFEILHDLEKNPVDLVVLGTHGRGGLDRLMIGSVASTIARKAPCSVLLIPPEAGLAEGISDAVATQTTPAWHSEQAAV
jgi:nucleotide-binding universal stress UspA family protein